MCVNNLPKVVYLKVERPGVEPRPFESRVQRHNHYTTRPQGGPLKTQTSGQCGQTRSHMSQKILQRHVQAVMDDNLLLSRKVKAF